jgi:2-methylcitrate dehydratase PrpD
VRSAPVQELIGKVSFAVRADLGGIESSGNPSTTVTVRLKDGRELCARADEARGSGGDPLTMEEISGKYRECVRGIQDEGKMEETIRAVAGLEELPEINRLTELLAQS